MAPAGKPAPRGPVRPGPAAAARQPLWRDASPGPALGTMLTARGHQDRGVETPTLRRVEDVKACAWTTAVRLWTRPSPRRLGTACSGARERAEGRPAAPAP